MIGIFIAFGESRGRFSDEDRVSFLAEIDTSLECSMDHPGASKFILNFEHAFPEKQVLELGADKIDAIVFTGPAAESSDSQSGRHIVVHPSGVLNLRFIGGEVSTPLCSYDDLKLWAKSSALSECLRNGFVVTAVMLEFLLEFVT